MTDVECADMPLVDLEFDENSSADTSSTDTSPAEATTATTSLQPENSQVATRTSDELITQAVSASMNQSMASIDLMAKASLVLESAITNASFDQKVSLLEQASKLSDSTSAAINAAANLYLALGIKVNCDTSINLSSIIPQSLQPSRTPVVPGFEADESLPSASKYNLTLTLKSTLDLTARQLVDYFLKGTGCQIVGRIVGTNTVTVRLENRQQLLHAVQILQAASYKGHLLIELATINTTIKSAYSVRTFPLERNKVADWIDEHDRLNLDAAIHSLHELNSGWFPNQDVEALEFYPASAPAGKDKKLKFVVFKIFVSQSAYRHFLRSSHDITNVDINGELVKVKEEVNVIQCWNCVSFGHYSNQCKAPFRCRFCTIDHAKNVECTQKDSPQCRICDSNNKLLEAKHAAGDSSPGVTHFKDWVIHPVGHCATSLTCKSLQHIKACHLLKLKHAAFRKLPYRHFRFRDIF